MKIAIFGATGRTGLEIVKHAVDRNFEVVAFVRDSNKLGNLKAQVSVVTGDIFSLTGVENAVKDCDVVISAIGPTKDSEPGFQPKATQAIIDGMKQAGVSRLITMTGAGVRAVGDQPKFVDKAIVKLMKIVAKKALADGADHAKIVQNSGLDWTIVRAPMLKNEPKTGLYAVGMVGSKNLMTSISRADAAKFILDVAEKHLYVDQMPLVAHEKHSRKN